MEMCLASDYERLGLGSDCNEGECDNCEYAQWLTPDELARESWYEHGDYLGDLEREEG